ARRVAQCAQLAQALPRSLYTRVDRGSRDDFLFLRAWRGVASGISRRAACVPGHTAGIPQSDRQLSGCRQPAEFRGGPGGNPMMRKLCLTSTLWAAGMLVTLLSSCSRDPDPAATKTEVTVEPGVFTVEHSETFKLARIESRALPIILNATGTISPDVTR